MGTRHDHCPALESAKHRTDTRRRLVFSTVRVAREADHFVGALQKAECSGPVAEPAIETTAISDERQQFELFSRN